jgi:hypothetical protein
VKYFRSRSISQGFWCVLLVFMMFALSLSAAAQVNNYYVSATGSDSNSGTSSATPWATCDHAIQNFSLGAGGATLNFAPGAYSSNCDFTRGGSSLTVRLVLQCTAQLVVGGANNCRGMQFTINKANYIDIGALPNFGFEYSNAAAGSAVNDNYQCGSNPTCTWGNSIHVFGNYFHDIGQTVNDASRGFGCPSGGAIQIPNAHGATVTDIQVIGNVIDHFGVTPPPNSSCNGAHGIYIATAGGIVENNIVTQAQYAGIHYYDQACDATISNNVLANNRNGMTFYGGNGCTPGLNTVNNNIIVNNGLGVNSSYSGQQYCTPGRPILLSNNIFFGNGSDFNNAQASCETRQAQKSENPTTTFVNYTGTATGDYHLKAGSVAIGGGTRQCGAGVRTPCVPASDFAAVTRPSTPSVGVYEHVSTSSALPPPAGLTATVQ